jgi:hypothetical protein
MQASKDVNHVLWKYTNNDSVASAAASGLISQIAVDNFKQALIFPYLSTEAERDAVVNALPNRLVVQHVKPGTRPVAHPHLKFLSEYLRTSVSSVDFTGKKVKLVGPKFNKQEIQDFSSADDLHFCTSHPMTDDVRRCLDSTNALKKKSRVLSTELGLLKSVVKSAKKSVETTNFVHSKASISEYAEKFREIAEMDEKIYDLQADLDKVNIMMDVINRGNSVQNRVVCNVGAEKCTEKADVLVSFDSLYDINLKSLMSNAHSMGASEVYAVLILPFGLTFVDSYVSEELCVRFQREKGSFKGFYMTHTKDMSDGYVHSNQSIMEMMQSSFVYADNSTWDYEILDSIAEMVLVRFTHASDSQRKVRKQLPAKFDSHCVILNPLKLFRSVPEYELIMVDESKLENAICSVVRSKKSDSLVEDTAAHVQSTFMKVMVGSTELQRGGRATNNMMDAMTCAALIEGSFRKNGIHRAYGYAKSNFTVNLLKDVADRLKSTFANWFPGIVEFFSSSKVDRFLRSRISLSDTILYSEADARYNLSNVVTQIFETAKSKLIPEDLFPSFRDIMKDGLAAFHYIFPKRFIPVVKDEEKFLEFQKMVTAVTKYRDEGRKIVAKLKKEETVDGPMIMRVIDGYRHYLAGMRAEARRLFKEAHVLNEKELIEIETDMTNEDLDRRMESYAAKKEISNQCYEIVKEMLAEVEVKELDEAKVAVEHVDRPEKFEHITGGKLHMQGKMDMASAAALEFNRFRFNEDRSLRTLSDKEKEMFEERFTIKGKLTNCIIDGETAEQEISSLYSTYIVDAADERGESLLKLKESVMAIAQKAVQGGYAAKVPTRNVRVINGYGGSGKTTKILRQFDPVDCAYVAPYADLVVDFCGEIQKKFPNYMKLDLKALPCKTFERLAQIKPSGRIFVLDESGSLPTAFLLLILALFDYEEFWFLGDEEQTGFYDRLGAFSDLKFTQLVPEDCVERYRFTYRYGPSVAAFLNSVYNYPVYSLANFDTPVRFHDLTEFSSETPGVNICISGDTVAEYSDRVRTMKTAKSSQGRTHARTNLVYTASDAHAAMAFRETGIVAASRCQESLDIYVDTVSRNSKAVTNMLAFERNFSAVFDVTIPDMRDF